MSRRSHHHATKKKIPIPSFSSLPVSPSDGSNSSSSSNEDIIKVSAEVGGNKTKLNDLDGGGEKLKEDTATAVSGMENRIKLRLNNFGTTTTETTSPSSSSLSLPMLLIQLEIALQVYLNHNKTKRISYKEFTKLVPKVILW